MKKIFLTTILATILFIGISNKTFAECKNGDSDCNDYNPNFYCCYHITEGFDKEGNPSKHVDIYKDLSANDSDTIKIGGSSFQDMGITSVSIPEGVTAIYDYAFKNNNLVSVNLPQSLTLIEEEAFNENNIKTITIPEKVTEMHWLSLGTVIEEIIVPDTIDMSHWNEDFMSNIEGDGPIIDHIKFSCLGNIEICKEKVAVLIKKSENGIGTCSWSTCIMQDENVSIAGVSESQCDDFDSYYWSGKSCANKKKGINCAENWKQNEDFCNRIRYTPAEAAEVLHNDNTNEVTITFKK